MNNHYKAYTNKDIEIMREMKSNGFSIAEIANAIDRTYAATSEALRAFGIAAKNRALSKFELALIRTKEKPYFLGKVLNLTPSQVSQARYRNKHK